MIEHTWTHPAAIPLNLTAEETSGVLLINENVEGMGMPKLPSFTQDTALLDGQTVTGWKAEPREVFWPILITNLPGGTGWEGFQTAFWKTMRPNSYGLWRVTKNGQYRELRCRFADDGGGAYANDPSLRGAEVHGITLIADDPWWKGPAVSKTFQTAQDQLPFFAVTSDRVFNIMSSNTVDNAFINNTGDVPSWPVFRLDGPVTGFQIAQYPLTGGAGPQISSSTITLSSGDYLIVDTTPTVQTATKFFSGGGSLNVTDQLTVSQFFSVAAGTAQNFYIVLNGGGSITATVAPNYFRAF